MERLIPGVSSACRNCAYRTTDRFPNSNYPCTRVKIELGIMTSPKIDFDTCKTYDPNLITSVKKMVERAHPFVNSFLSSLPR